MNDPTLKNSYQKLKLNNFGTSILTIFGNFGCLKIDQTQIIDNLEMAI